MATARGRAASAELRGSTLSPLAVGSENRCALFTTSFTLTPTLPHTHSNPLRTHAFGSCHSIDADRDRDRVAAVTPSVRHGAQRAHQMGVHRKGQKEREAKQMR